MSPTCGHCGNAQVNFPCITGELNGIFFTDSWFCSMSCFHAHCAQRNIRPRAEIKDDSLNIEITISSNTISGVGTSEWHRIVNDMIVSAAMLVVDKIARIKETTGQREPKDENQSNSPVDSATPIRRSG